MKPSDEEDNNKVVGKPSTEKTSEKSSTKKALNPVESGWYFCTLNKYSFRKLLQ
jgi:hypothetical protein